MLSIDLCLEPYNGGIYRRGDNVPHILDQCTIWSIHG